MQLLIWAPVMVMIPDITKALRVLIPISHKRVCQSNKHIYAGGLGNLVMLFSYAGFRGPVLPEPTTCGRLAASRYDACGVPPMDQMNSLCGC